MGPLFLSCVIHRPILWIFCTLSACLSMYAAHTAHRKLIVHTPTEVNRGGPKLSVF
jgi:hypothetical protein